MGQRILIFGITGLDKHKCLETFVAWCSSHTRGALKQKVFNFEKEFLFNPARGGMASYLFLDSDQPVQHRTWRNAWNRFCEELTAYEKDNPSDDILISIHGGMVRGYYGSRTFVQPEELAKLKPHRIVTLLENVYDSWWRTTDRADGLEMLGIPTLEQLLLARRVEVLVADQVAHSSDPPVRHLVLSVHHPCETLWKWLYSSNPKLVYLCFPISAPRRLYTKKGDPSGISDVNAFLSEAYRFQSGDDDLVMICPLAIDELPLQKTLDDTTCHEVMLDEHGKQVLDDDGEPIILARFDRESLCWDLSQTVFGGAQVISPGPMQPARRKGIPVTQIETAMGMIKTDVGWRDFRLVDQASYLIAFNPTFKGEDKVSRSVRQELNYASVKMPVFIVQDPSHDPNELTAEYVGQVGTMMKGPTSLRVNQKKSLAEVVGIISKL